MQRVQRRCGEGGAEAAVEQGRVMHTMCTVRCALHSALRSVHYHCAVRCAACTTTAQCIARCALPLRSALCGAHYYMRRGVHLVELPVEEVADQWPVLQRR